MRPQKHGRQSLAGHFFVFANQCGWVVEGVVDGALVLDEPSGDIVDELGMFMVPDGALLGWLIVLGVPVAGAAVPEFMVLLFDIEPDGAAIDPGFVICCWFNCAVVASSADVSVVADFFMAR